MICILISPNHYLKKSVWINMIKWYCYFTNSFTHIPFTYHSILYLILILFISILRLGEEFYLRYLRMININKTSKKQLFQSFSIFFKSILIIIIKIIPFIIIMRFKNRKKRWNNSYQIPLFSYQSYHPLTLLFKSNIISFF